MWHVVVVLANLALACFLLIVSPVVFEFSHREAFLYGPAPTSLIIVSAGFALVWSVIRTVFVAQSYRKFGPVTKPTS